MSGIGVAEASDVKLAVDRLLVWMLVRWRMCVFFLYLMRRMSRI